MDFESALFLLPGLVIGLTVHEAAHAISAKWLGDRTAEKMGRISLNPLRHLSLYGTLAIFLLGFGWGKPVIVNLYNFKKPKFYYLLSSLAGPASNLLICGVCLAVLYMQPPLMFFKALVPIFLINGMLAAINLVPVPPLDGSKIWPCLIPGMKPTISGKWSIVWVVVLIIALQTGGISKILGPIQDVMWKVLPSYKYEMADKHSEKRPDGFPACLYGIEEAGSIRYRSYPDRNLDPNAYSMSYVVNEDDLSDDFFWLVHTTLKRDKWVQLRYQLEDPDLERSSEWEMDTDADVWNEKLVEYWGNRNSEVMILHFLRNNEEKWDNWVACNQFYYEKETHFGQYLEAYKQYHPEEFPEGDVSVE